MAITYPLTFPNINSPSAITIRQRTMVAQTLSPFTGSRQVQKHQGQWWEAEVTLPPMLNATAATWEAFLTKLNGVEGTFLMGDPTRATPRGSAGGTPLVNGASQTGNDLIIDGASLSATGWLLAGDWIQLGTSNTSRLYKVLEDVNTDGSGNATIPIWPELNASTTPADGATVVVTGTVGLWHMVDNALEWSAIPFNHSIIFACRSLP